MSDLENINSNFIPKIKVFENKNNEFLKQLKTKDHILIWIIFLILSSPLRRRKVKGSFWPQKS